MQIFVILSFESLSLPVYQLCSSINNLLFICNFTVVSWHKSCPIGRVGPPQPPMFVFVFVSYTFVFVSWQKSCLIGRVGRPLQGGAVSLSFSFACHHITQKGTQHSCLLNKHVMTVFWLMLKYGRSDVSKNLNNASKCLTLWLWGTWFIIWRITRSWKKEFVFSKNEQFWEDMTQDSKDQ